MNMEGNLDFNGLLVIVDRENLTVSLFLSTAIYETKKIARQVRCSVSGGDAVKILHGTGPSGTMPLIYYNLAGEKIKDDMGGVAGVSITVYSPGVRNNNMALLHILSGVPHSSIILLIKAVLKGICALETCAKKSQPPSTDIDDVDARTVQGSKRNR